VRQRLCEREKELSAPVINVVSAWKIHYERERVRRRYNKDRDRVRGRDRVKIRC
jgi:hypothetical protein